MESDEDPCQSLPELADSDFESDAESVLEYQCEVLSSDQVIQLMNQHVHQVSGVVALPPATTRHLLNHLRWNADKLIDVFYNGDGKDQLFADAKAPRPRAPGPGGPPPDCDICCSPLGAGGAESLGLECQHTFCTDCWTEYLSTQIVDEGVGPSLRCPGFDCDVLVNDDIVTRVIQDPEVQSRYRRLVTNSFIQNNKLLKRCPEPSCENVVKVEYVDAQPVTCRCGRTFCFRCCTAWHEPATCELMKLWEVKCQDDAETLNWIRLNTKPCPCCKSAIQKMSGCNHMFCRTCNYEFCWMCMEAWSTHGVTGMCNKYKQEKKEGPSEAKQKKSLLRYLFYYNRYLVHRNSVKFDKALYQKVEHKMKSVQEEKSLPSFDVKFMKEAVDVLCKCRQVLMYSYVFAYYISNNNQKDIFEDNQKDLEAALECLSEYLERRINGENFMLVKKLLLDKSMYCDSRRKTLLQHVREGFEQGLWDTRKFCK